MSQALEPAILLAAHESQTLDKKTQPSRKLSVSDLWNKTQNVLTCDINKDWYGIGKLTLLKSRFCTNWKKRKDELARWRYSKVDFVRIGREVTMI